MNINDIRRILVVGTGTMGQKIALQCARCGYDVIAYDANAKSLANAQAKIAAYAGELVERKLLAPEQSGPALARITLTANPEDGAAADLVSESIFEDVELKARVFAQFDRICPPHTIFTTNTSTLLPSMWAQATGRPDRFAALHFYGVWDAALADIMPHPGTAPEVVALLVAFAKRIGQVPFVMPKEHPGYVGNAIMGAINDTAMDLVFGKGVTTIEDFDRAEMVVLGVGLPCFANLDFVGLDTLHHIIESSLKQAPDPRKQAFADQLKRDYLDRGFLGVKSGRGFYTYPNPAWSRPGFLKGEASTGND